MGMGTRQKRIKRIMASTLGDFIRECMVDEENRDNFRRTWSGGFGRSNDDREPQYIPLPYGTHRDADSLQESNWVQIEKIMNESDSFSWISEHAGVTTHREGSCLNGWNEMMHVRADDAVAIKAAMGIMSALADHPVLNEEDYYEREWSANHPGNGQCYADMCDCADGHHSRMNDDDEYAGCRAWLAGELKEQEAPGWRSFESSDVDEECETDGDGQAYAQGVMADLYSRNIHYHYSTEHDRVSVWTWWCGADGCGQWVVMSREDANLIRKHNLFSDIPAAMQQGELF